MFSLINSQIYGLTNSNNKTIAIKNSKLDKMKVTSSFLEKFIKNEVLVGGGTAVTVDIQNGNFEKMKILKNQQIASNNNRFSNNNNNNNTNTNTNSNNYGTVGRLLKSEIQNGNNNQNNNYNANLNQNRNVNSTNNESKLKKLNGNCSDASNSSGVHLKINRNNVQRIKSNEMVKLSPPSIVLENSSSSDNLKIEARRIKMDAAQRKKFIQMIQFLDQQNQQLEHELAKEKKRRAEELSKIIKSLLCFEAKLKSEKKVINQKLYEKDDEISRLVRLNRNLKDKLKNSTNNNFDKESSVDIPGNDIDDVILNEIDCKYPEALYCPNCRKEFYDLHIKENWTQIGKDGRNMKGDHQLNSTGSTEHGSSSDETLSSSFYGARRSIRYTSKRTFGTFRDYMRSRCMSIDHPSLETSGGDEENASTISRDESHTTSSYEKMNVYSSKMERIHGVRRVSSFEFDSETDHHLAFRKLNLSSSGPETDHSSPPECDDDEVFYPAESFTSTRSNKEFSEIQPSIEKFEASTDDWYASASDVDETENLRTKCYGYSNTVNPVLECVNQILLQESMEEALSESTNELAHNTENNNNANSVNNNLACLDSNENPQSSLSNPSSVNSSINGKDGNVTTIRKRVHFSTKNSMVHVPRDDEDDILINPLIQSVVANQSHLKTDQNCNYESIYSNEYEPIGSEHNSSNLYVDMESKLGDSITSFSEVNKGKLNGKQPPALPPKPANLIKFKKAIKVAPLIADKLNQVECQEKIEPDYCSISEINEAINIQIVAADVHKIPDGISSSSNDDAMSQKTDDTTDGENFSDVPKLPNVAAIIPPKTPKKSDRRKSFDEKSPVKSPIKSPTGQQLFRPKSPGQVKRQHVPHILAEINKKILQNSGTPLKQVNLTIPINPIKKILLKPTHLPLVPILKQTSPISPTGQKSKITITPTVTNRLNEVVEDKLPLQEEFDWYNLDAEYEKSSSANHPDVIQAATIDEDPLNQSVEYNLDEEFSLSNNNQPDIIKENSSEENRLPKINLKEETVKEEDEENLNQENDETSAAQTTDLENKFPVVVDPTPIRKNSTKRPNFLKLIDNAGLNTKPLPRQRKIYFSGPFV